MPSAKNSKKGKRPFKAPLRKMGVAKATVKGDTLIVTLWRRAVTAQKGGIKTGPTAGRPLIERVEDPRTIKFECSDSVHAEVLSRHVLKLNATNRRSGIVYQIKRLATDRERLMQVIARAAKRKVYRDKIREEKRQARLREEARLEAMHKKFETRS